MNSDTVWLVISIGLLAIAAALWVRRRLKLSRARSWPTQTGWVDSTAVRLEQRGNNQSVHVAEVTYSYAVQGETYSGSLRRTFLLKGRADKWVGPYAKGRPLLVRYNPNDLRDSVLFEREQPAQVSDADRIPSSSGT